MSVVTYFVETSQAYLDTAAETQFGAVAETVGTLLVLGTTLVVILVVALCAVAIVPWYLWGKPKAWRKMMLAGMQRDFSWEKSAREYAALYERLVAK